MNSCSFSPYDDDDLNDECNFPGFSHHHHQLDPSGSPSGVAVRLFPRPRSEQRHFVSAHSVYDEPHTNSDVGCGNRVRSRRHFSSVFIPWDTAGEMMMICRVMMLGKRTVYCARLRHSQEERQSSSISCENRIPIGTFIHAIYKKVIDFYSDFRANDVSRSSPVWSRDTTSWFPDKTSVNQIRNYLSEKMSNNVL